MRLFLWGEFSKNVYKAVWVYFILAWVKNSSYFTKNIWPTAEINLTIRLHKCRNIVMINELIATSYISQENTLQLIISKIITTKINIK